MNFGNVFFGVIAVMIVAFAVFAYLCDAERCARTECTETNVRSIVGDSDSRRAGRSTIRAHYGNKYRLYKNAVHGSDSSDADLRETWILDAK